MQWTVDNLDSSGGLMTNKNKSLAYESDGNVFVGTIPSLGHSWGERGKFHWFENKIIRKDFSQEFRNLKLFSKIPGFQFF